MTREKLSTTNTVVGFANSIGRDERPVIEQPIYKNSSGYFTNEEGIYTYVTKEELCDAEANGLFTWLDKAVPAIQNGVILLFEDPEDISNDKDILPGLRTQYCSLNDAQALLGKISLAYLRCGFKLLENDHLSEAIPFIEKSVRAHPNAVGLYVLLWGCSHLLDDRDAERYNLYCLGERFHWLGGYQDVPLDRTAARNIDEITIDQSASHTSFYTSGHNDRPVFSVKGIPTPATLAIFSELNTLLSAHSNLSFVRDIAMAATLHAMLYELPQEHEIIQLIRSTHLKNKEYLIRFISNSSEIQISFQSLVNLIQRTSDLDAQEVAGGVLAKITKNVSTGEEGRIWNKKLMDLNNELTTATVQQAGIQFALANALVQIPNSPTYERLNRGYLMKAAERLKKQDIARENAIRIFELAPTFDNLTQIRNNDDLNALETIADAYRIYGHMALYNGNIDEASKAFDQGYGRISEVILLRGTDYSGYARIGEKMAYCALRVAQITRDKTLANTAWEQYEQVDRILLAKGQKPSDYFYNCRDAAERLRKNNINCSVVRDHELINPIDSGVNKRRGYYLSTHIDQLRNRINELRGKFRKGLTTPENTLLEADVIEQYVKDNIMLRSHYVMLVGLQLEASAKLGTESGRIENLVEVLKSDAETKDVYILEQLAAHYERVGGIQEAKVWNNKILLNDSQDRPALMRRDKLEAAAANTPEDSGRVVDRLIERASKEDALEARRLYFAAGEIASASYSRWETPGLNIAEEWYSNAVSVMKPPHPAAVQRLAWMQFRQGNGKKALETISDKMPRDDVRGAILFAQIALSLGYNGNDYREAVERLSKVISINPFAFKLILCDLVIELALKGEEGKKLCQSLIEGGMVHPSFVLKLYKLLTVRSWFDPIIIGKALERVQARGTDTMEAPLIEYLHAAWLRSNIDLSFDVSVFDNYKDILPAILSRPIGVPIMVRALKAQDTLLGKYNAHEKFSTENQEFIKIFESDCEKATRWYHQDLSAIPDEIKHKALNGIGKSACDLSEFVGKHSEVIDHELSDLGDNPIIFADENLLGGVIENIFNVSETKLVIRLKEGGFSFEAGQLSNSSRKSEELLFWRYVIDDTHSGSLKSTGFDLPVSST